LTSIHSVATALKKQKKARRKTQAGKNRMMQEKTKNPKTIDRTVTTDLLYGSSNEFVVTGEIENTSITETVKANSSGDSGGGSGSRLSRVQRLSKVRRLSRVVTAKNKKKEEKEIAGGTEVKSSSPEMQGV
tara:strand:+ start:92 stop:484 length:393 start_codon:yes stop_codon:yes gene_type:complete